LGVIDFLVDCVHTFFDLEFRGDRIKVAYLSALVFNLAKGAHLLIQVQTSRTIISSHNIGYGEYLPLGYHQAHLPLC
jgi:hypothetical protein